MPAPLVHRPEIDVPAIEDTPEGEALVWRVRCACTATNTARYYSASEARKAAEAHKAAVAPPPGQACREPGKHRTQPHDHCLLCICQDPLPGFDTFGAAPRKGPPSTPCPL
ncbi:hypothetical protein [Nocardiopsis sp. LOL_012]|uniref:hypothetical protein n=1 Tax=Nocardiopsis sp. LOL_012 TaxID=3345409 RepID=UPI003A898845